mgnify:CR=1 FL=1
MVFLAVVLQLELLCPLEATIKAITITAGITVNIKLTVSMGAVTVPAAARVTVPALFITVNIGRELTVSMA